MRLKITIGGLVQGVGFRPFVARLAKETGLTGYVLNDTNGVLIEAEGSKEHLDEFLLRIEREAPPLSSIYSLRYAFAGGKGYDGFEIRKSRDTGQKKTLIMPDIAVCSECLSDVEDPEDRRFQYPFTNCTNCGPRFTIVKGMPYDRENTSMKVFHMCPECEQEYHLSSDRRFHAQPVACPLCGPSVSLYSGDGALLRVNAMAVAQAADYIRDGHIIAVKGIGGYHLICDAVSGETVERLRKRKQREEKPLAVMFPDIDSIKDVAEINSLEQRAICSVERPIVIVKRKDSVALSGSVSPDNDTIGVFLPYTPLHHILMQKIKKPVIATSANRTDEPIVKDEHDAFTRLSGIADYILTNNREIVRRCDDSVVKISAGQQVPIRRSRGYAPLPVSLPFKMNRPVLALGPYMNSTIAIGLEDRVFISQHVGDLDNPLATECYEDTVRDLLGLIDVEPEVVVSDMHPGYYSTKFGERHFRDRLVKVQHHFAHILSCMADNEIPVGAEVIGFAFDGTGYGQDGTIWGGEVLVASYREFRRAYSLRPFRLPGSEMAIREPFRTCLALLYETFDMGLLDIDFIPGSREERLFFMHMIKKGINSPVTTSMGRLIDGVSSLIGVKHKTSYHAQAAIALEQSASRSDTTASYPCTVAGTTIDYRQLIEQIVNDITSDVPKETMAKKFHNSIVEVIVTISEKMRETNKLSTVALSGGVFQNAIILENSFYRLKERGFSPIIHQTVPPNDGGISLGQTVFGNFCKGGNVR